MKQCRVQESLWNTNSFAYSFLHFTKCIIISDGHSGKSFILSVKDILEGGYSTCIWITSYLYKIKIHLDDWTADKLSLWVINEKQMFDNAGKNLTLYELLFSEVSCTDIYV